VDATGRTSAAALDPHLYAGTSGVAWFLGELYAATGDTMARRAALGAIEQALWKADGIAAGDRVGLFTGWIGIAFAAVRVGVTLNEPALLVRARQLLERLEPTYAAVANADHMAGTAGAIVGLLGLREVLGEPRLTQAAIRLGETTLARATKRARDWSWKTTNRSREVNLTGFAHGAAGIACALMELWQATGDRRYHRAAELGFAYERRWFAAGARNWPDLRGYPARGVRPSDELPCGSMWCHGAPGVAMSRLRAYQITGDERWKADALVALQTTRTLTESAVRGRTTNFSLCHGLAGNAEIVAAGTDILPENFPDGPRVAADVARFGIERYGDGARPWPCGAAGPTPALMVGLAGTGYFYLRLVNPKLPSVLLLRPAAARTAVEPPAVPAFESAPSHA
jgi:lantibiotic modifying enzyme